MVAFSTISMAQKKKLPKTLNTRGGKPNKRVLAKENTRIALEKASLVLFATNGFKATTMEMIAKEAGVSRGLAYSYFKAKEEILYEIMGGFAEKNKSLVNNILNKDFTAIEKVALLLEEVISDAIGTETQRNRSRVCINMILQPEFLDTIQPLKKLLNTKQKEILHILDIILESLGTDNPSIEKDYIQTVVQGIIYMSLMRGTKYSHKEMIETLLQRYKK